MNPLLLLAPRLATNRLWARAGAVPSFDINPAALGHARDLITGTVLGGGTVNSATPAWEAGPGGILAQPAANAPVIAYDPTTSRPLGLRDWQGVTNLLLQSNTFNTTWAQVNVTVTPNAAQSPDDAANGSTLLINSAGAALIQGSQSFAAGSTLTVSIFAKKNASNFLRFELGNTVSCWFNLNTGTTGTNQSGSGNVLFSAKSIQQYPNGWYRCFLTVTTTTITTIGVNVFATNTDGASSSVNSSISIFGAQLNTGSVAGPYVPTTTTSASSTAEAIDITSLPGGINNIRTVYARVRTPASGTRGIISLNDNSSSNRLELLTNGTDPRAVAVTSGSTVADINGGTIAANTALRIAARFDGDNYAVSINGAPVVTDNAGAKAIVDRIFLGRTQAGEYLNGIIEELATWTQPLGNSQLQAVTQ